MSFAFMTIPRRRSDQGCTSKITSSSTGECAKRRRHIWQMNAELGETVLGVC